MPNGLTDLISAPPARVLLVAGLAFLVIAIVGEISGRFDPGKIGRIASGVLGLVFVVVALFYNNLIGLDNGAQPTGTPESPALTEDVTMTAIEPSPTSESATPTSVPVVDTPTPAVEANLLLVYDDIAAHVINVSDVTLSLVGVTFERVSADGAVTAEFAASVWEDADVSALSPTNCLQVLIPIDEYERDEACKSVQDFEPSAPQDLRFWIGSANSSEFNVFLHDEIIQTCAIQNGQCEFFLPQP